jgi:hypothetical protein
MLEQDIVKYLRGLGYDVEVFYATYDQLRARCHDFPHTPLKPFADALEVAAERIYGKVPVDVLIVSKDGVDICIPSPRDLPRLDGPRYEAVHVKYRSDLGEHIDVIERFLRYRIPYEIKCALKGCDAPAAEEEVPVRGEPPEEEPLREVVPQRAEPPSDAEPPSEESPIAEAGLAEDSGSDGTHSVVQGFGEALPARSRDFSMALKEFVNAWTKYAESVPEEEALKALTTFQPAFALRLLEILDKGPRGILEFALAEGWDIRGKKAQELIEMLDAGTLFDCIAECRAPVEEKLYGMLKKCIGKEEAMEIARRCA